MLLRFLTYNILCSLCFWDMDVAPWPERSSQLEYTITKYQPDVYGLQELIFREEVARFTLPNYTAIYYDGPPLEALPYADSTVYFNNNRFRLIDSGIIWMGPTPDEPWSAGFTRRFPRSTAWVVLQEISTGFEFYFNTVHYDNTGNCDAKIPSSELVLDRARPYLDTMPVIFSGDFNSAESPERGGSCTEAYTMLLDDGYINTHDVAENIYLEMTPGFPTPDDEYEHGMRIDHILFQANATLFPNIRVTNWIENREVFGEENNRASDHWAIVADVEF
jgi:endonuclease/exonuclease/phosphatase family metal-dependent hydrolase